MKITKRIKYIQESSSQNEAKREAWSMSGSDVSEVCVNTRCACAAFAINMLHLDNAVKSVTSERPDLKADANFQIRRRFGFQPDGGVD